MLDGHSGLAEPLPFASSNRHKHKEGGGIPGITFGGQKKRELWDWVEAAGTVALRFEGVKENTRERKRTI